MSPLRADLALDHRYEIRRESSPNASPLAEETSDPKFSPSWYVNLFGGQGALILGSQDPRYGYGIAVGYGRPDGHLRFKSIPAQLVFEGYWDTTGSRGVGGGTSNRTEAFGALAIMRYKWPRDKQMNGFYADIGWGMQYANKPTVDLDTKLNSTPVLGVGGFFRYNEHHELMLGARLLHISNGGTKKPNHGQNQLLIVVGTRFK